MESPRLAKGVGIPPSDASKLEWYLDNSQKRREEMKERLKKVISMLHTRRTMHAVKRRHKKPFHLRTGLGVKKERASINSRVKSTLFGKSFRLRSSGSQQKKHLRALWVSLLAQTSRAQTMIETLREYQRVRDQHEAALLIQRLWKKNRHHRKILQMSRVSRIFYGWTINVRFIMRIRMNIQRSNDAVNMVKDFIRASSAPMHRWSKLVHMYMHKIRTCQRIWKEYRQITSYRVQLLSKIWEEHEKKALAEQAHEYHHAAALNLWDADELQRKVAFQEAKKRQKRRTVTPGAEDKRKSFLTLRNSIRGSQKNKQTQIADGSLLLETLDDMEDTFTTPAMDESKKRYFESQASIKTAFYRSPVEGLGSKKTPVPRWLRAKKVVYAMDPVTNKFIACRYAPLPAPMTIKSAMIRRYLTHQRRAYASVVRKIRAQNLKYLLNEKLKLNKHDAKFILTQPVDLAQEAISLHFNATFQMEQSSSPSMLIVMAAKNDIMFLVKEAFAVSRQIREARSQKIVDALNEGKQGPLDCGPMQTSTWSARMGSTPDEREQAANAATEALIALYESRGDKFDRRSMETVKIKIRDRDSISTTTSSRYMEPNKVTPRMSKKGRKLSQALAFNNIKEPENSDIPPVDIPQLGVQHTDETSATPSMEGPTEGPTLSSRSEYTMDSTTSYIASQKDHPLWFEEPEDGFDEMRNGGWFSSTDDVDVAKTAEDSEFAGKSKSVPEESNKQTESVKESDHKGNILDTVLKTPIKARSVHFVLGELGGAPLTARSQPSPRVEEKAGGVEIPLFTKSTIRRASVHEYADIKTRSKVEEKKKRSRGMEVDQQLETQPRTSPKPAKSQQRGKSFRSSGDFLQNDVTHLDSPRDLVMRTQFSLANVLHPSQTPRTKSRLTETSRRAFSPALNRAGQDMLSPH